MCSTEHNTPAQGAIYQTTTKDVGYYAIPVARTCLNLCLVSLCLPSSSRFDDLLPTISYLRASQGRRAVKIPTAATCFYCFRSVFSLSSSQIQSSCFPLLPTIALGFPPVYAREAIHRLPDGPQENDQGKGCGCNANS